MSFYRSLMTAVAALGLATSVFAADESASTQAASTDATAAKQVTAMQTADASSTTAATSSEAATTMDKVDLNKATAKDLMKVKGLSSGKAKAIVAYRKKHGEFKSVDDLKNVRGFKKMNEETMKEIQEHLTIG